ncbi:Midasin [Mycena chlorophos]|uniref:Midasin n=1 Tax=Mycena chlorophos TaxID=658473 RepID=A0A8H6T1G6_MYCCL|nr:Midasin [Mycena chlorophos]
MIAFNSALNTEVSVKRSFGRSGHPWEFNLRDVLRWASLLQTVKPAMVPADLLRVVYLDRFRDADDKRRAQELFDRIFQAESSQRTPIWALSPGHVQIGAFHSPRHNLATRARPNRVLTSHLAGLESIGHCVSQSWLAIVTGGHDSGKTELIRTLADLSGQSLRRVSLNSATDTMDILGSFEQVDRNAYVADLVSELLSVADSHFNSIAGSNSQIHLARDSLCASVTTGHGILAAVSALVDSLAPIAESSKLRSLEADIRQAVQSRHAAGRFEWVDGPLIRAMKQGHWIVLDGANLCSPSVLDRLNSLCEPNGFLTLSERGFVDGAVQVLKPHPNFRIFMTVDPQYGELSRAMRNRGIEVHLEVPVALDDVLVLQDQRRLPFGDVDAAEFDGMRRGVAHVRASDLRESLPSALALDHHSALSALMNYPGHNENSNAFFPFLARSIPVPHRSLFRRILAHPTSAVLELLDRVPTKYLEPAILSSWDAYVQASGAPMEFVSAQPFSLFTSYADAKPLLLALDLDVELFMHAQGGSPPFQSSNKSSGSARASAEIESVILAAQSFAVSTLQQLATIDVTHHVAPMEISSAVLKYANELRNILSKAHFDYSAVHVITEWLVAALKDGRVESSVLESHAVALQQIISLSSGLGIQEIWRRFATTLFQFDPRLVRLHDLAACLDSTPENQALRRKCLDVLCLCSLPNQPLDEALEKLQKDVLAHLEEGAGEVVRSDKSVDISSLAAELALIAHPKNIANTMTQLFETECMRSSNPLLHLVGYQHLAWAFDAGLEHFGPLVRVQTQWLNDIWTTTHNEGPALLFKPFQLRSVFEACDVKGSSLANLVVFEQQIQRHARLAALESEQTETRLSQLTSMLRQSISMICGCFVEGEVMTESLGGILDIISAAQNQPFRDTATRFLRPTLERLLAQPTVQQLGSSWIALSRVVFELFVPDAPVDPAAMQNFATGFWTRHAETLEEQISLHARLEQLTTGIRDNVIVRYLEAQLTETRARILTLPTVAKREDVARLQLFWSEVVQFQAHRLDSVYPDFGDLSAPLKLATLFLRLGLRLICARTQSSLDLDRFSMALVSFPSIYAATLLLDLPAVTTTPFRHVLLNLSAASQMADPLGSRLHVIETSYAQAYSLWSIDRSRMETEEAASSSLYRRKDYDDVGDAELEEREFLSLFPSFEDVFDAQNGSSPAKVESSHVSTDEMAKLTKLHFELFGDVASVSRAEFGHLRLETIEGLLKTRFPSLSDSLDGESLPLQLSLLGSRLRSLHTQSSTAYNFYVDENIAEAKRANAVVVALKVRLQALINEWPDQMVLHHLVERCDAVVALDVGSPIAKILSALEQLLLQTADWEVYSNRHNTLKDHQTALTNLIVDWRRMELSCWNGLLQSQANTFEAGVAEWWFHLYNATVRGALDATEQDGVDKYLESLIPLLDDFLRNGPLGQFQNRMRLIRTFAMFCKHLAASKSGKQQDTLARVARILDATRSYFALFSAGAAAALSDQRAALEKELRGFIKLASWKDVNVQALKASAQRTHHQLYKLIRKFRDILRQPVANCMHVAPAKDAETKELLIHSPSILIPDAIPVFPGPEAASEKPHLLNLNRTFSTLGAILSTQVSPLIATHSALVVDDLAVNIIVTSKELAAVAIPNVPAEKKEKFHKALNQLKRAGFSATPKPDVLARQSDLRWLREQLAMKHSTEDAIKAEEYFNRLTGLLPGLRSSLSNHHPDLVTRDLQKGVMFVESVFAMALDARARLSDASALFEQLSRLTRRLRLLVSHPVITCHGPQLAVELRDLHHILFEFGGILKETLDGIDAFDAVRGSRSALSSEISSLEFANSALCSGIKTVSENVALSSYPILLQDEQTVVNDVLAHLAHAQELLKSWLVAHSSFRYLISRVDSWLGSRVVPSFASAEAAVNHQNTDVVIDLLLVHVQSLVPTSPAPDIEDAQQDRYIQTSYHAMRNMTQLLKLGQTTECLDQVILQLAVHGGAHIASRIQRFLPFLELYLQLAENQVIAHCEWTKALFKLDLVLCSIASTIAKDGFCQPPEGDADNSGGQTADASGGVGLGAGEGSENVSKEIEEESQVEGLKGDDENDGPQDHGADDDAIEMDEDIGGQLEDVPDEGKEEEEKENEDGSEADPEEQLGDLDASDPSAVDEKLWGDEKGPEDSSQKDDKTNKDHSEQQSGDSEVVAKEGEQQPKSKDKKEEGEQASEPPSTEPENDVNDGGIEDEDEQPDVSGAPMQDYMQDADTLDLPDDIDFGNDQEEPTADQEMEDDGPDDDEAMDDQDQADHETPHEPESMPENAPSENDPEDTDVQMQTAEQEPAEESPEDKDPDSAVAQPDVTAGDGDGDPNEQTGDPVGQSSSTGQAGSAAGAAGHQAASEDKMESREGPLHSEEQAQEDTAQAADATAGTAPSGSQEGQAQSQSNLSPLTTNPLRSLGDALKEVRQRFDDILEATSDGTHDNVKPMDDDIAAQAEYLRPDDDDHDLALGPAGDEQVAKLNELTLLDDIPGTDVVPMDEPTSVARDEHVDGAIVQDTVPSSQRHATVKELSLKAEIDSEDDAQAEVELRKWQADGVPAEGAERIWRIYEALTHDLAYALCEQLRLILEPTLATRLKGDYRTGKRLNMKKIISYIASDYTKDKIWLRRTRPSQREYQVLISLDDSKSMAESHSVHLAFQTLALVAKSLTRLEAGDVAIAKFGQHVDILHGFDEGPFTDQAGMKLMNAFRFDQKATNMLSLVETSLRAFEAGRERRAMSSSTAADLWQLQFIISDGVWQGHQNHDKLRTMLRRAEEQRVMIVFIIVDALHASGSDRSILKMEKAEYKNVDGRMELQLERYLDFVPFRVLCCSAVC